MSSREVVVFAWDGISAPTDHFGGTLSSKIHNQKKVSAVPFLGPCWVMHWFALCVLIPWFLSRLGGRFAALPPCGFGFRLSDCGRFFRLLVCVALPSAVPASVPWSRLGFVSGPDPVLVGPILWLHRHYLTRTYL